MAVTAQHHKFSSSFKCPRMSVWKQKEKNDNENKGTDIWLISSEESFNYVKFICRRHFDPDSCVWTVEILSVCARDGHTDLIAESIWNCGVYWCQIDCQVSVCVCVCAASSRENMAKKRNDWEVAKWSGCELWTLNMNIHQALYYHESSCERIVHCILIWHNWFLIELSWQRRNWFKIH